MNQSSVILDYKYLEVFPKLSSLHVSDTAERQQCDVKSINKEHWICFMRENGIQT